MSESAATREILFEKKDGRIYLGLNVDGDFCIQLSPEKETALLALLLKQENAKVGL